MTKRIVIIDYNEGGRLANQLWPYIGIYAYCLDKGFVMENWSFFQYSKYFQIKTEIIIGTLIQKIFYLLEKLVSRDGYDNFIRRYRKIYKFIIRLIIWLNKKSVIEAKDISYVLPKIIYLPPTKNCDNRFNIFEHNKKNKLFLSGWLFRNPAGLKKYHKEIVEYFQPNKKIKKNIDLFLDNLRKKYRNIVGVHIRQGDYKYKYRNGELYFNEKEVNEFLKQYWGIFNKDNQKTCFIICSDDNIDLSVFKNLDVVKSEMSAVEDLFLLSMTDIIIGSDSTFGAFASYYGNIPLIVFQRDGVDWNYYKGKKKYFENKYLTTVHY